MMSPSPYNKFSDSYHPPTLLQVLPSLQSGGVERGTVEIARAAVEAGFNSLVVSAGGPMVSQLYQGGSKHLTLHLDSKNPVTIYRNAQKIASICREYRVDILHARSRAPAWSAYLAAQKTGCHFITTFHGIYGTSWALKRWYNSIMVRGERIIAISEYTANHMKENYHFDHDRMVLIPRGVDLEYFDPKKVQPNRIIQLMNRFHIPEERTIILLPGRITRWKGHLFLLEALKKLPPDSFLCLFAGDDKGHQSYRAELESFIKYHQLQSSVKFVGNIADMPAAYMLADIVVSASLAPEAFGRVAIEAQAMQRMVIATDIGGSCETILDGKTGWRIPPHNVEALSQALMHVFSLTEEARKECGERARQHVAAHFSLTQMCNKTLNLYRELMASSEFKEDKDSDINTEVSVGDHS